MMDKPLSCKLTETDSMVLKGIAICAMLCHHLFTCVPGRVGVSYDGLPLLVGEIGKCCVSLFVFVSGYGIAYGYDKLPDDFGERRTWRSWLAYTAKRFLHFYLQYWPIFLIFVPIGVFVFHRPLSVPYGDHVNILKHLILDLCGIQGLQSYNETWWFNQLILILYLIAPIFYFLARRACVPSIILFFILSVFGHHLPFTLLGVDSYGISFLMGMVLWQKHWSLSNSLCKLPKWLLQSFSLLLIIVAMVMRHSDWLSMGGIRADVFITLGLVLLLTMCPKSSYIETPIAILGKHSANIYMIHTFIYGKWFPEFIYSFHYPFLIFGVLIAICLGISILIELVKKVFGFYRFQSILDKKLIQYENSL